MNEPPVNEIPFDILQHATLTLPDGQTADLPIVVGSEGEKAVDIARLRATTGYITLDDGYTNTGSCMSDITFIDGEKGILRYRGYPIQEIAKRCSFVEAAQLVIWGELPTPEQRHHFSDILAENSALPEDFLPHFSAFPPHAHPMSILSAMVNALQTYDLPGMTIDSDEEFERVSATLISKVRTIAAASFKSSIGEPIMYPRYDLRYVENFLHMMFSRPYRDYVPSAEATRALNLFLILHADHEQNCSTSTVRMVASGQANLYASVAAGVCALWGPLHGGANQAVIEMLDLIQESGMSTREYITKVKDRTAGIKLMGFGHRVYRSYDPRAQILKQACDDLLESLHITDPRLAIARELEEVALEDDYFVQRKLYPNVDFYSGTILTALGIPPEMFTVIFAIGRVAGWIANWKEIHDSANSRIYRPRQIYTGPNEREWINRFQRERNTTQGFIVPEELRSHTA
ncbi:MAG: citrate synthase [Propionibacteriaceae bacterium]|jgi:citrate synthase|nr:citrate synthase [Propionibacteriaceae bacterium]